MENTGDMQSNSSGTGGALPEPSKTDTVVAIKNTPVKNWEGRWVSDDTMAIPATKAKENDDDSLNCRPDNHGK